MNGKKMVNGTQMEIAIALNNVTRLRKELGVNAWDLNAELTEGVWGAF